jgi:hypothetical protein
MELKEEKKYKERKLQEEKKRAAKYAHKHPRYIVRYGLCF